MKNKITLLLFSILIFIASCKKELKSPNSSQPTGHSSELLLPPQAYQVGSGEQINYNMKDGSTITLQKVNNEYVFSGDIILSQTQLKMIQDNSISNGQIAENHIRTQSTFLSNNTNFNMLWPGGIVYYTLNNSINQTNILAAISHWTTNTQIQFVQRTNQANYVEFASSPSTPGAAGDSQLGMVGGKQQIRLVDYVDKGSIIHEIGHALGLMHEQTRADRDGYINVNFGNINSNWTSQYQTYGSYSGYEIGTFDFQSIMLYGSYYDQVGYSGNTSPQMTKKDGYNSTFTGQRNGLSAGDISGINYLYFNHVFAKLRYVPLDEVINDTYRQYGRYSIYVDFYQNAQCTIPTTLAYPIRIHISENRLYYDDPYRATSSTSENYFEASAGSSSLLMYPDRTTADFTAEYDGTAVSGSYFQSILFAGAVGFVGVYY